MRSDIEQLERRLEINQMFLRFLAVILVLLLMAMAVILFKLFSGLEPLQDEAPFHELTLYEQESPEVGASGLWIGHNL